LALRQLSDVWFDEVFAMVNYQPFNESTGTTEKFSEQRIHEWLASRPLQTDRCDWAIIDKDSHEFAGEVVLNELEPEKNSMNLRISLADESWANRGIGTESMRLVLAFAFDELKLDKVALTVLVTNARAHRSYEKLGFADGRQFNEGKHRWQRMSITKLQFIEAMCLREMGKWLSADWSFTFDSGKRRAGICYYNEKRISLSKHLVLLHDFDQAQQVLWHEIAHALSGKEAGHGKDWLNQAKSLGYRAEKFSGNLIAENTATWIGHCPAGHTHYRYRKPTRALSCGKCSASFSKAAAIKWQHRDSIETDSIQK
jgi:RimJ/RimL family protein N-acetyltransferase/predicted SprT family Zn-dependent metalloprotease